MFKLNINTKEGKTFKLEAEAPSLIGKQLKDKINGSDISGDLSGYEFEITGASDKSGFTAHQSVEGIGLKKILLSYEKAMKKRPKREGKKKRTNYTPKGLRLRKTVRGKIISDAIVQINLKILKQGSKKLSEIFPDQNKTLETSAEQPTEKVEETPKKEETSEQKEEVKTKDKKE